MTSCSSYSGQACEIEAKFSRNILRIEIPPRPGILERVMAEMNAEDPDFRTLAHLMTTDAGLASGIIKTANSPIFGLMTKATTVHHALTLLGLIMVARTVSGLALKKTFAEVKGLDWFWDSSSRTALAAAWFVKQTGVREGLRMQDAHTYGLFRDCGIPVLMKVCEGYGDVLKLAFQEKQGSFVDVELEAINHDHATTGADLARSWGLPEPICAAIQYHHHIDLIGSGDTIPASTKRMIAVGHVAEFLQSAGDDTSASEWEKVAEACLDYLDMSRSELDGMRPEAAEAITKAMD